MEAVEGPPNGTACKVGEEFWDDLLAYIDEGSVIPFVGPELLTIKTDGADIPRSLRSPDRQTLAFLPRTIAPG